MGMFDSYYSEQPTKENWDIILEVQMKNGPCLLNSYWPGCKSDIPDGIYIGLEGIVVISNGFVVTVSNVITDKWNQKYKITPEFSNGIWKLFKEIHEDIR